MKLCLNYIGDREYLQGSTLWQNLHGHLGLGDKYTIKIMDFIKTDNIEISKVNKTAKATLNINGEMFYINPLPRSAEVRREIDDEETFWKKIVKSNVEYRVSLADSLGFSIMRMSISMFKLFLFERYPAKCMYRWFFVQCDVLGNLNAYGDDIIISNFFSNNTISKCSLYIDKMHIAYLYFCCAKK